MKQLIAVMLCAIVPIAAFGTDNSFKIAYDGGSLPDVKAGVGLRLSMDRDVVRLASSHRDLGFDRDESEIAVIPVSAITEISYGQDVHRRVGAAVGLAFVSLGVGALMLLSKSKKHYIGLTWDDNGKKGGISFQADKSDYRGLLSGLEGVTGKKAINSDALNVKN